MPSVCEVSVVDCYSNYRYLCGGPVSYLVVQYILVVSHRSLALVTRIPYMSFLADEYRHDLITRLQTCTAS